MYCLVPTNVGLVIHCLLDEQMEMMWVPNHVRIQIAISLHKVPGEDIISMVEESRITTIYALFSLQIRNRNFLHRSWHRPLHAVDMAIDDYIRTLCRDYEGNKPLVFWSIHLVLPHTIY